MQLNSVTQSHTNWCIGEFTVSYPKTLQLRPLIERYPWLLVGGWLKIWHERLKLAVLRKHAIPWMASPTNLVIWDCLVPRLHSKVIFVTWKQMWIIYFWHSLLEPCHLITSHFTMALSKTTLLCPWLTFRSWHAILWHESIPAIRGATTVQFPATFLLPGWQLLTGPQNSSSHDLGRPHFGKKCWRAQWPATSKIMQHIGIYHVHQVITAS